ncbi:MAG: DUF488 domain-containing protein [Chamaesiphon sp.]|nr:DUF488 domain-containing protein [Chamaesiphon sp.]
MQIFTVGHSNHSIEKFVEILKRNGVSAIADVRSSPFSRYAPHFNQSSLKHSLNANIISYAFLGEQLGARSKNPECYIDGKARYDLIAKTKEFAKGLDRIMEGSRKYQIALMCAEQDPITCHRSILACKNLKNSELNIQHILRNGNLESNENLEKRLLKIHNLECSYKCNTNYK